MFFTYRIAIHQETTSSLSLWKRAGVRMAEERTFLNQSPGGLRYALSPPYRLQLSDNVTGARCNVPLLSKRDISTFPHPGYLPEGEGKSYRFSYPGGHQGPHRSNDCRGTLQRAPAFQAGHFYLPSPWLFPGGRGTEL